MHTTIYTFSIYENWISIYEDPYYFLYGIWKKSKDFDGLWITDNFLFHKKLASLRELPWHASPNVVRDHATNEKSFSRAFPGFGENIYARKYADYAEAVSM